LVGQGATEYLVLLAVVLIVALVSVALLGFFPGMASDAQLTQSQAYWQSATPIAIIESGARQVCHSTGNYTYPYLRLRNTGSYPITITKIYTGNTSTSYVWIGNWSPEALMNTRLTMAPGEEKILGYENFYTGMPTGSWQFFGWGGADTLGYVPVIRNAAQSLCQRDAPFGMLVADGFGFEYSETINGQAVTKRQIGAKPLLIKCTDPYMGYC